MSRYYGEVINLSLRDISMLKKFKIVDIKKRFLGLVKIYTVELPSKKIEEIAKDFQSIAIPPNTARLTSMIK